MTRIGWPYGSILDLTKKNHIFPPQWAAHPTGQWENSLKIWYSAMPWPFSAKNGHFLGLSPSRIITLGDSCCGLYTLFKPVYTFYLHRYGKFNVLGCIIIIFQNWSEFIVTSMWRKWIKEAPYSWIKTMFPWCHFHFLSFNLLKKGKQKEKITLPCSSFIYEGGKEPIWVTTE